MQLGEEAGQFLGAGLRCPLERRLLWNENLLLLLLEKLADSLGFLEKSLLLLKGRCF